jgi:hypothetical protein
MNATMMAKPNRRNIQTNRHESWIGVAISNQSTIVDNIQLVLEIVFFLQQKKTNMDVKHH